MSNIEHELRKAIGVIHKKGAVRQDYLEKVLNAVEDLSEDDWQELSEEAQTWFQKAMKAHNKGKSIPDYPEDEASEEEDKPVAKKAKKPKDEEVEEAETEEEGEEDGDDNGSDASFKDSEDSEGDDETSKDDENEESNDEDEESNEEEDEEMSDEKPNKKAKGKTAPAKGKDKTPTKKGAVKKGPVPRAKYDEDQTIKVLKEKCSYKEGSTKFVQFKLLVKHNGKAVGKFLAAGGKRARLNKAVKLGQVKVV